MSHCKQTAEEFIQNTFSPHVAVLCSPDAELLCQKNNLTFQQLIQPFCRLSSEGEQKYHFWINFRKTSLVLILKKTLQSQYTSLMFIRPTFVSIKYY